MVFLMHSSAPRNPPNVLDVVVIIQHNTIMCFFLLCVLNPIAFALSGGEDYELLFSINQIDYEKLKKDPDFTIVGYVTDISEGNSFIANDGSSHKLIAQGWDSTKV